MSIITYITSLIYDQQNLSYLILTILLCFFLFYKPSLYIIIWTSFGVLFNNFIIQDPRSDIITLYGFTQIFLAPLMMVKYFFSKRSSIKNPISISFCIFLIISFFSIILGKHDFFTSLRGWFNYLAIFEFMMLSSIFMYNVRKLKQLVNCLIISALIYSCIGIMQYILRLEYQSPYIIRTISDYNNPYVFRVSSITGLPSAFAIYLIFPIVIIYQLYIIKKFSWGRMLLFATIIAAEIFTFTRASEIACILGLFWCTLISYRDIKRILVFLIIVALIFYILNYKIMVGAIVRLWDGFSGRSENLDRTLSYLFENVLFGRGIASGSAAYYDYISSHNKFVQMVFEAGIFGLIAFLVILYNIFRSLWRIYIVSQNEYIKNISFTLFVTSIAYVFNAFFVSHLFFSIITLPYWIIFGSVLGNCPEAFNIYLAKKDTVRFSRNKLIYE